MWAEQIGFVSQKDPSLGQPSNGRLSGISRVVVPSMAPNCGFILGACIDRLIELVDDFDRVGFGRPDSTSGRRNVAGLINAKYVTLFY